MKPDYCTLQYKACFSEPHLILGPHLFPQGGYHLNNPPSMNPLISAPKSARFEERHKVHFLAYLRLAFLVSHPCIFDQMLDFLE